MKRSVRMDKIADINLGIENLASASFASVLAHFKHHQHQLDQLLTYREEYQNRLSSRLNDAISVSELNDYQYFFATVDEAIKQQTETVNRIGKQVEASRRIWIKRRQNTMKISRMVANIKDVEFAAEQKNEQKELDELNQQRYPQNRNQLHPH